jgi:hypothetical protein
MILALPLSAVALVVVAISMVLSHRRAIAR